MIARGERRRILERLAAGSITAEHANELLERAATDSGPAPSAGPVRGSVWQLSLDGHAGRPRPLRRTGTHAERGGR